MFRSKLPKVVSSTLAMYEQALVRPIPICPLSRSRGTPLPSPVLAQFTAALGVCGDVLADDDQLEHAWSQLPHLLK